MLDEIKKSKVLILGFGLEGKATLRYLSKKFPQKKIGVADKQVVSCKLQASNKNVNFHCGSNYLRYLKNYNLIIKSPGIKTNLPELVKFKKQGGIITSATNIFMSQVKGTVIGVTGSKGKSTVSSLLYSVFKEAKKKVYLVGNIGKPALDVLKNDSAETFYIYEMSSYQLEDLRYKPQYALINNLFPEHLDYHGSLEKYYKAKLQLIKNNKLRITNKKTIQNLQVIVYNAGSAELKRRIEQKSCSSIMFNDGNKSRIKGDYLVSGDEKIVKISEIKLLGKHNLENILGVIEISLVLGVESQVLRKAIKKFKGLEHRLEYVGEFQGIRFYNDSISTTPESTIQGIQALGSKVDTLIVGGLDRGYDFSELAEVIFKSKIRNLILFPETGEKIIQNLKFKIQNYSVDNLHDCVKLAFEHTKKGKVCLLSPASPSYNLFRNFEERGNLYKKYIKKLK